MELVKYVISTGDSYFVSKNVWIGNQYDKSINDFTKFNDLLINV